MRRDSINYTVVGLFVIGAAAALFYVLFRLTGGSGPVDTYFVTYDNVSGIKFGTPVLYEGYNIGQVELITPQEHDGRLRFKLELSVRQGWKIPRDSVASLVASGLLSAITVEIKAGRMPESLAPGAEIVAHERADLLSTLNETAKDFRSLSRDNIRPLLANFNEKVDLVAADLHQLATVDIKRMLDTATSRIDSPQVFEQIDALLGKLNHSAEQIEILVGNENQRHVSEILVNIKSMAGNLNALVLRIEATRKQMNGVLSRADGLVTNANGLVSENRPNLRIAIGDLRKTLAIVAQNIDSIAYNLEGSSRNMQEFTRQIRENPSLLLGSSPQKERSP